MVGSDKTQTELFDRGVVAHIGLVRHIGAATLSRPVDLDDFTQDVVACAFAKRHQLRDLSRLRAWVASIARNTAQNWNRNQRFTFTELSDALSLSLPVPLADEQLSDRERWAALVDALSRLPESDQALIRAYYVDELSAREIQARTRLSAAAVRKRLSRARGLLRERLGPLLGVLGVLDSVHTPRRFGEVPRGNNRMGVTGSVACSLAVVGWLGFGAYQVEQAVWDAALLAPRSDTVATVELLTSGFHPPVTLATAGEREADTGRRITPAPEEEKHMSKVLDVAPSKNISTVVGALHAMLQRAGQSRWTTDRLQGMLGNAFSFEMRTGAGEVWQEANLDYEGGFFEMLPELGYRIQRFDAVQKDKDGDFQGLKADAWEAVRASIDRGVPAVAWSPMSVEQKAAGLSAHVWGLLVGYDEAEETYTVRHDYVNGGQETFDVRYDAIGHTDSAEWFCVLVYEKLEPSDGRDAHLRALRNAVAFANGTRFPEDSNYHVDARGFAAYELWRDAVESGVAAPKHSQYHAFELKVLRGHAAAYLRELVDIFPAVAADLEESAAHYDRLVETSTRLHDFCGEYRDAEVFPEDTGAEAATMVTAALQAERDAVASIEAALAALDE